MIYDHELNHIRMICKAFNQFYSNQVGLIIVVLQVVRIRNYSDPKNYLIKVRKNKFYLNNQSSNIKLHVYIQYTLSKRSMSSLSIF